MSQNVSNKKNCNTITIMQLFYSSNSTFFLGFFSSSCEGFYQFLCAFQMLTNYTIPLDYIRSIYSRLKLDSSQKNSNFKIRFQMYGRKSILSTTKMRCQVECAMNLRSCDGASARAHSLWIQKMRRKKKEEKRKNISKMFECSKWNSR